jgi:phosphoglucomutase
MISSSFYCEDAMNKKIEYWKNFKALDPQLKVLLEKASATELKDAFYTNLEFGTAGMRGLLGAGPNRLNIYTIRKANLAFARYLLQYPNAKERGVAIAYDNRHMSKEFAMESATVLAKNGIKSYVFSSLRATPELSYAVRILNCEGGIVVTASHNPKEYNGYKVYDDKGCQLVPDLIDQVIAEINKIEDELSIDVTLNDIQKKLIHIIDEEVDVPYLNAVLGCQLRPDQDKSKIKLVFTPQHGTANVPVREVLSRAGYNTVPLLSQCDPDPDFSNTKSPNPEEKIAYEGAIALAQTEHADAVLSTDPDADRLGIAVLHNNEYVLLTGNQTGSILIDYLFSTRRELNKMPKNPVMFNTVVTSDLGEKIATFYGVDTEKTLTGFKFIGDKIAQYEVNHKKDFVFGYEESYGYLFEPFVRDKDAIQACLMLAECITHHKNHGKTLVDVLNGLYERHGTHLEDQVSLTLKGEEGAQRIKTILNHFRTETISDFASIKVTCKEDYMTSLRDDYGQQSILDFPKSDVIKYHLEDGSWIAIRPSGTEPKCKFYFCIVAKDQKEVQSKFNAIKADLQKHYQ